MIRIYKTKTDEGTSGGGCSCVSCLVFIFVFWAVVAAVATPWGQLHIGLWPPAIELAK